MTDFTYDPQVHTHAIIPELAGEGNPLPIVHTTGGDVPKLTGVKREVRIWVTASYEHRIDTMPDTFVQVGDGLTNGYDSEGFCVISVPEMACTFTDDEEAEEIARLATAHLDIPS